jgi:hypothetical protein
LNYKEEVSMTKQRARLLLLIVIGLTLVSTSPVFGQNTGERGAQPVSKQQSRLLSLVEANIIATHAYQVRLAQKSGKADSACYAAGNLSESGLEAIVAHQAGLLSSDRAALRAWARGQKSAFDPSKDLEPILASSLVVPDRAPVNVFTEYLRQHAKASRDRARSIASLYQTVMEVERDGDLLQDQFHFYIALQLPVYVGQLHLPGSDSAFLAAGKELEPRTCVSPFDTNGAAWQIAGRKIWNWGEKNLHIRDEDVLARELLQEADVRSIVPQIRALPAQRIAVIGHSFTMGLHWSSPSSFVPVVTAIFKKENPKVEFKQFAAGGLTASRAYRNFYKDALAWKPDKVLLVVMERKDEDYEALKQIGEGFIKAGAKVYTFDNIHDPEGHDEAAIKRSIEVARDSGMTVIEVDQLISAAPDRERFVCLDGIHMTEPYHRLMAKQWLKFLVGAREAKLDQRVSAVR